VGAVRYASAPLGPRDDFRIGSPTCQACHRLPPEQRGSSRVIETGGGTMLRTVIPFRNREACHRCHDPAQRINGVMILDLDAGGLRSTMNRELGWMVGGTAALALVLVAAIALVVRLVLLRRLQRFETTARLIAQGDLERRVPVGGADTISWLATEFNSMADSMSGLVTEVQDQRQRLETVLNSVDDGIVVLDPRRRVVAANDAFLQRTGRSRTDAVGCFCRDVAPGVCTASDCPTVACMQSGVRQVRICERRAPDGSIRWEEVHASPIRGPAGALLQVVEVWRDISERRATEGRLAESHRLASLGLLASGFSHEINTPLATVLTCVEGILREGPRPGESAVDWASVSESATIAREQVLRCRGITQHFLRMSRGQPSAPILVDLRDVLAAVARLVDAAAREHAVRLDVEPVARTVHGWADEAELQHVVINLVLNAIQACAPGGHVSIGVVDGDPVRVSVADDGCGIAEEDQQRIFEPFFGRRRGGTGLGLFLSLNFVRRWGGDITVRSRPGAGSTFELRLPGAAAAPQGV
jgi:PAS domain S-box-containing protein